MYAFLFDRKSVTLMVVLFLATLGSLFWAGLSLGSWIGPELTRRTTSIPFEPTQAADRLEIAPAAATRSRTDPAAAPTADEPLRPEAETTSAAATTHSRSTSAKDTNEGSLSTLSYSTTPDLSLSASTALQAEPPVAPDQPPAYDAVDTEPAAPRVVEAESSPTRQSSAMTAQAEPVDAEPVDAAPEETPPIIANHLPEEPPATLPSLGKVSPATGSTGQAPPTLAAPHDYESQTASPANRETASGLPGEIPAAKQSAAELVRPAAEIVAAPSAQPEPPPATRTVYSVQVGSFPRLAAASRLLERLVLAGYEPYLQPARTPRGRDVHTVRIGHYDTKREALEAAADFAAREGTTAVVRWRDVP